jgi:hypothetical protein
MEHMFFDFIEALDHLLPEQIFLAEILERLCKLLGSLTESTILDLFLLASLMVSPMMFP